VRKDVHCYMLDSRVPLPGLKQGFISNCILFNNLVLWRRVPAIYRDEIWPLSRILGRPAQSTTSSLVFYCLYFATNVWCIKDIQRYSNYDNYRVAQKSNYRVINKSHYSLPKILNFFVKLKYQPSTIILSVDIKYSARDLPRDVNNYTRPTK